jgi:ABC-type glycerol-3-phosphate transport system substrate-binding protein
MKALLTTALMVAVPFGLAQTGTLKVAHYFDPLGGVHLEQSLAWLEAITETFEQEGDGIQVDYELYAWDEIDERMIIDIRAGIPHDVTFTSPQLMAQHDEAGSLLDLEPYVSKWDREEVEQFSWSPVWDAFPLGIPTGIHTRLVAYRTDLFEEHGVSAAPQTLEQLVEAAKALTVDENGDGQPEVWGLGIYLGPQRATVELAFAPLLWHFGGELWNAESGRATFASEAGVQAAEFLYDLIHTHQVTPRWAVGGNYDEVVLNGLLDGQFAMTWGYGSYWIPALEANGMVSGCWPATPDCSAVSAGVFVTPTEPRAQFSNAWTVSIHSLSRQPDEAARYLETLLRAGTLEEFADAGLPARRATWEQSAYESEFYGAWFDAAQAGRSMPPTTNYGELADAVAVALSEILLQEAPIAATLQRFEDDFNAAYGAE